MKTPHAYSPTYKALHWATALLMVGLLLVGLYMSDYAPETSKPTLYNFHKATGMLLLGVVLLRSALRLTRGVPKLLPGPRWQYLAAHTAHAALWVCMFAMPLSGWLMSSAAGYPVSFYGLFNLPIFFSEPNLPLSAFAHKIHVILPNILWAIIALHVAGALYHHFVKRDNTLKRMLP